MLRCRQRALGEQLATGLDALLEALRIVETVDAEHDEIGVTQVGPDLRGRGRSPRGRVARRVISAVSIDIGNAPTRTQRPSCSSSSSSPVAPVSWRASRAKFVAPPGTWKPTRSAPQEAFDELAAPRDLHVQLLRRERRVEEEPDSHVGPERCAASSGRVAGGSREPTPSLPAWPTPRPPRRTGGSPRRTPATSRRSKLGARTVS